MTDAYCHFTWQIMTHDADGKPITSILYCAGLECLEHFNCITLTRNSNRDILVTASPNQNVDCESLYLSRAYHADSSRPALQRIYPGNLPHTKLSKYLGRYFVLNHCGPVADHNHIPLPTRVLHYPTSYSTVHPWQALREITPQYRSGKYAVRISKLGSFPLTTQLEALFAHVLDDFSLVVLGFCEK